MYQSLIRKERHLLLPAYPTPNGRLHLGHIAGPFLHMDVLARSLKLFGAKVGMVSMVDSTDAYVLFQARQQNKTPSDIVESNFKNIRNDLSKMKIDLDLFINPLSQPYQERYQSILKDFLDQLSEHQDLSYKDETYFYDDNIEEYLSGPWIKGFCPYCNESVVGFFCEKCGANIQPTELKDLTCYNGESFNSFKEYHLRNAFINKKIVPELQDYLVQFNLSDKHKKIIQRHIDDSEHLTRITHASNWGLNIKGLGNFLNYGTVHAANVLLSEAYGELKQLDYQMARKTSSF